MIKTKTTRNIISNIFIATVVAIFLLSAVFSKIVKADSGVSLLDISPEGGMVEVAPGDSFRLRVRAASGGDVIRELEIDHNYENSSEFPEFSVYANSSDPYTDPDDPSDPSRQIFEQLGATVTYSGNQDGDLSSEEGEWTLDFGVGITDFIIEQGGDLRLYLALMGGDSSWGSMFEVSPENTFNFKLVRGGSTAEEPIAGSEKAPGVPNTSGANKSGMTEGAIQALIFTLGVICSFVTLMTISRYKKSL